MFYFTYIFLTTKGFVCIAFIFSIPSSVYISVFSFFVIPFTTALVIAIDLRIGGQGRREQSLKNLFIQNDDADVTQTRNHLYIGFFMGISEMFFCFISFFFLVCCLWLSCQGRDMFSCIIKNN